MKIIYKGIHGRQGVWSLGGENGIVHLGRTIWGISSCIVLREFFLTHLQPPLIVQK